MFRKYNLIHKHRLTLYNSYAHLVPKRFQVTRIKQDNSHISSKNNCELSVTHFVRCTGCCVLPVKLSNSFSNRYFNTFHKLQRSNTPEEKTNIKHALDQVYSKSMQVEGHGNVEIPVGSVPVLNSKTTIRQMNYDEMEFTEDLIKLFSHPKNKLHNAFCVLAQEKGQGSLKLSPSYRTVKNSKISTWICTYMLRWPEEIKFIAADATKAQASHKAALAALVWLYKQNKLTEQAMPVIYAKEEVKILSKERLPSLLIDKATMEDMRKIVDIYNNEMVPLLIKNELDDDELIEDADEGEDNWVEEPNDVRFKGVKKQRFLGLDVYKSKEKIELPISKYKEQFIDLLKSNQVLIVKGEPGCGKSTRIPQYVLESWAQEVFANEPCRIVVTQPRRIAAISLAQRVSKERNEVLGNIVGYQVRLNSNFRPATGRILYCTTGILLRHLQSDPTLTNFTHVVLDEAHERDVNTDLLMNILKSTVKENPKLKLVVMSATIDTAVFSEYFGGVAVMDVPGFTHPVEENFLDDFDIDIAKTAKMCEGEVPAVVHEDVARVIKFIHETKPEGAILCFLPGWEDINKISRMLPQTSELTTYCLHSRLQDHDQWKIFTRPPPGVRKVILSTNIAETSVTIDDVVYVVDTGIHKDKRFDVEKGINCIDNHWISKASAMQRKGRAGRVQPGESYHLYPRSKYQNFVEYTLPEIMRTSLTKIVLDSKVYAQNMAALEFMGNLLTPPEEKSTLKAVEELKELELLDGDEQLTTLGKTLAEFQLEPKLAKAMVNAVVFKCVTPVVDIVTMFSAETEFFMSALIDKDVVNRIKSGFCSTSDHLAMMRLFEKWLEIHEEYDEHKLNRFCDRVSVAPHKMKTIQMLRKIHFGYLNNGLSDVLPVSDDYSDNDEMVKAVLFSGVGNVLQHRNWDVVKNRLKNNVNLLLTRNNHKATVTQESVNFKRYKYPTNFLMYINETRSNIRRTTVVRECALIPQISVMLFSNKDLETRKIGALVSNDGMPEDPVKLFLEDTNIQLICDRKQAEDIIECKKAIMSCYQYYIKQLTDTGAHNPEINSIWDDILSLLDRILNKNAVTR